MRLTCMAVMVLITAAPTLAEMPDASAVMREALVSAQAGQLESALAKMQSAVALRPTHPAYLYNLACLQSLAGHPGSALETLQRLADFGIYTPAARDPDFDPLKENSVFKSITAKFEQNLLPRGEAETQYTLPDQRGLIEGIVVRANGEIFFGDMHLRCVWRRSPDGKLTRFTAPDDRLPGIGGLVVDEARGLLWAACSAQEVMAGWSEAHANQSGLAAFDLDSGELKQYHPVPADGRAHATVDLTIAADGTIYLSDSAAPIIWQLAPGASHLEAFIEDARFRSLQGLAVAADHRTLFVADYALGLFQIDLPTRRISGLSTPARHTLVGIDGLAREGSRLIAVQNGVNPARVLAINLDEHGHPLSVDELAAALPGMTDITLGSIDDGAFIFIGDAGWRFHGKGKLPSSGEVREIPILGLDLDR